MKGREKEVQMEGSKQQLSALGAAIFWLSVAAFLLVFLIQVGMENG